jgi:hypothetical protein
MTTELSTHTRLILAAIRAAKKVNAPKVEVVFGDGSIVHVVLVPEPVAVGGDRQVAA